MLPYVKETANENLPHGSGNSNRGSVSNKFLNTVYVYIRHGKQIKTYKQIKLYLR